MRFSNTLIVSVLFLGCVSAVDAAETKPNIVFIFIDDMGYGDIGPFGNEVNQTPHLDRLAEEGMKFTDFYVASTACTPSRTALMTGCYADRLGMDGSVVFPADPRGLNPSEITIADMLKEQGYATGCFGKWHLGDAPEFLPTRHGFDEYEGIPYSNDMWPVNKAVRNNYKGWPPLPYLKQDQVVAHVPGAPSQALLCEAATDATTDFIERNRNRPFFAYVPHAFVHLPRLVSEEQAARADGDITRAQVEAVDTSVGRIVATLKELGIAENTLVFFTSDNGGARGTSMGPLRGGKGGPKYEGHMREPTLAWWPGTIPAGTVNSEIATTIDILPTIAALTGANVPTDRIIDGKDVSSLLLDPKADSPHKELYYEYEGIRQGKWKLVYPKPDAKAALYDLDADIGETTNLAAEYPEKVNELSALLKAHEQRVTSARRPAAFVDDPQPLLKDPGDLPTLAEYLGREDMKAAGKVTK